MRRLILVLCGLYLFPFGLWASDQDIRLNSLGFLPQYAKRVSVTADCQAFNLRRVSDDQIVWNGRAQGPRSQQGLEQEVWLLDFSEFQAVGRYVVEVPGVGRSVEFEIGEDVYRQAYVTAMRGFYLWRCGTAVRGEYQGNVFSQEACHLQDGYQDYMGLDLTGQRDGTGGWHDAGDYGKYTVNAGLTLANLMWAWIHFGDQLKDIDLDLPATAPGLPEFLQEIKWETDWLLKMQYPDGSGRVSHKLTRLNFSGFIMPQDDHEKRYFTDWGTAATANFVGAMAMAARIFEPYDTAYAQRCLEAAQVSYAFLQSHPETKRWGQDEFKTGGYKSPDTDDRLWAAAEMWETTGRAECLHDLETRLAAEPHDVGLEYGRKPKQGTVDVDWDWENVRNLAVFTYVMSPRDGRDAATLKRVRRDVIKAADDIVAHGQKDVYGRPFERYYWGCNGAVARQVLNLQIAYRLEPKEVYLDTALDAIAHLFGRNVYNRSYVTGLGINPPLHPHDRRCGADAIDAPWPGYLVGGGHPGPNDWKDEEPDYRTNEIAINWQGALVYALAGFVGQQSDGDFSEFNRHLHPLGRILELEETYVWGCCPIQGPDGKVHVFFSRWPSKYGMGGWIHKSEIAHAVADQPEGPYRDIETVLAPRGEGFWDATTCHNPHIKAVEGGYALFYMGNSNRKTNTKRIGLATAPSLRGPWTRRDEPILLPGSEDQWDNHCTTNPSVVLHPSGQIWLYYKSWNSSDYYNSNHPTVRGNRKYGLAIAEQLEGPYVKCPHNPLIDFSGRGDNRQLEDAFIYLQDGTFKMLARDMGIFNHEFGLYLESADGLHWSEPKIAYQEVSHYITQPPAPKHLKKYGRFERPQLLFQEGKPTHLFVTTQGGKATSSSPFVFEIKD